MSNDKDNVIFLAFRNETPTEVVEYLACGQCKNKTWAAVYDAEGAGFPRLKCACCGSVAGRFGWVDPAEVKNHD